jgi:hypothetical protein
MSEADEIRSLERLATRLDRGAAQARRLRVPSVGPPPDIITYANDDLGLELFPRQGTILKLACLGRGPRGEELWTDYDRHVIAEWIGNYVETGENGIQPDIYARLAWNLGLGRRWFREMVFCGGRRGGKGLIGSILISYQLLWLLSLGNPQACFNIAPGKRLMVLVFAAQHTQAKTNQWQDVVDRVRDSDRFAPFHPRVRGSSLYLCTPHDLERIGTLEPSDTDIIQYASLEVRACGATPLGGRGPTTIGFAFDEEAHAHNAGANRSAQEIYSATMPSLDQFRDQALIYQASSPWTPDGQFHENCQRAVNRDPDGTPSFPDMLYFQLTSWDPYLDWERAHEIPMLPGGSTFSVKHGAPQIYDEHLQALERANPESFATERRSLFRRDTNTYLSATRIAQFFAPFDGRTLSAQTQGALDRQYYMHGDPSRSNANFGFACAHIEYIGNEPHVIFDLLHVWKPTDFPHNDNEIDYRVVTAEIIGYLDAFNPVQITFDGWNSAGLIDNLRAHANSRSRPHLIRIADLLATQANNWVTAETFKTALGLRLVHAYHYPTLEGELLGLRFNGRRVDHPTTGPYVTKDLADCVMTLTNQLIGSHINAIITGQLSALPVHAHPFDLGPRPLSPDHPAAQLTRMTRNIAVRARSRVELAYRPERGDRFLSRRQQVHKYYRNRPR